MSQSHALDVSKGTQQEHKKSALPTSSIVRIIGFLLMLGVLVAGLIFGFIWFSGGSGMASAPIAAPILELADGDTRSLFEIDSEASHARFVIDEVLLGNPYTVIGQTQDLAGQMLIDMQSPANSVLGAIRVNLRTLSTDNEFRNRAIRGQILQSEQAAYEFAEFVPTVLEGLPDSIAIGDTVNFQIRGYLTVHGVNQEVVFDTRLDISSAEEIEGYAWTTVKYTDFGLTIPEAAGVAGVSESLRLELEFVASAK